MAEKKKQHFVPRLYMRNFAGQPDQQNISLYNFSSETYIANIPYKDQNYVNYFYGKDGQLEDALGKIEGPASAVITDVLSNDALPERMSDDFHILLLFALFQAARTRAAAAETNEQVEKFVKALARQDPTIAGAADEIGAKFNNAPAEALRAVAQNYPIALDLRWKLFLTSTERLFITSDHPVILYNQFLEKRPTGGSHIGLACKGLQLFFPLGPRHLLMIYDDDVYRVGGRRQFETSLEAAHEDVAALNNLQAANADQLLVFSPQTNIQHVAQAVAEGGPHRIAEKVTVNCYEGLNEDSGTLLHMSRNDLRIGLILPSVVIRPSAAGPQLSNRAVHVRDPMLMEIHEEFRTRVASGQYKSSQFGDFIRKLFSSNPFDDLL